jgi:hypothetical protein
METLAWLVGAALFGRRIDVIDFNTRQPDLAVLTIGTLGRIRESTPPGGEARSAVLPPERRNEIATNWVKRP